MNAAAVQIVDSHIHFWDPHTLHYPWLADLPPLRRAFLPADYTAALADIPVTHVVFVEGNCRPEETCREVEFVERLARSEPRVAGIVACADVADSGRLGGTLDALARSPRLKGIRQNIQGQPAGFALRRGFVDGVREVGRRKLVFDLCVTHDQLHEVVGLVRECPDTRFVLDHCGKPAIRHRQLDPWRGDIALLAGCDNVCCKLSGLLTEAGADRWSADDLRPYAEWVVHCFGKERVMYGSDWPVLTLAGTYGDWYRFTQQVTAGWSPGDARRFYGDNAIRVYGL